MPPPNIRCASIRGSKLGILAFSSTSTKAASNNPNHWSAHPKESHDPALRHLTPEQYLPYALNTYRVLLTRGTHTTHIHATDPDTHHLLQTLILQAGVAVGLGAAWLGVRSDGSTTGPYPAWQV
ncbi:DNA/RNA helicase domain-containing protein, partial [Streptomyces sp. NPDC040750]|uniref:DNA/RNA helicase domain-containing protein n=1 Tax=Streptomyces sp. NPDC040750 TaxID=3154491 RepID=UPI0033F54287